MMMKISSSMMMRTRMARMKMMVARVVRATRKVVDGIKVLP
jgi:hypothetical protein